MDDMPHDPVTDLGLAAAALHELFREYRGAGFTDEQSLYLAGQILREQVRLAANS